MINFYFGPVNLVIGQLETLIGQSHKNMKYERSPGYEALLAEDDPQIMKTISETADWVTQTTDLASKLLAGLKCSHVDDALRRLSHWPKMQTRSWSELNTRARAARDALDTELKDYSYFQYSKQKGLTLKTWEDDWKAALAAFPSIRRDVICAVDCYALEQDNASVFHCMRILEKGLGAIAADVGLTFDLQQWHNIIEQIESKIAEERKTLPKGASRNDRLQFLSESTKEFFHFKDGWRNHVAHGRGNYDEHQALSVLEHVRTFMNLLASRLSEEFP